ncbi:hemolysin family protein [Tautonia plasticadhaerens]|uniref:Magnesium and cobalt efflux protein CorC n=1 Tax=Tautonia plasticadhaerens TaxID=2527974 RepID=A0A518H6V6_9BACT|nr:hemolysin family protein [Tautonia plasticadhaerens]QDV36555.1 Magnesium and cobalt efflux protein CorC [Tautonia plasticadhaerens]
MSALTLGAIGLATLAVAAWNILAVLVSRALLTYSRSQLEAVCEARGRPDLADEIEGDWERAERSTSVHATVSGLLLLALLGLAASKWPAGAGASGMIAAWVVVGLTLRVGAGVAGRVFAESLLERAWPAARLLIRSASPALLAGSALESAVKRRRRGPRRLDRPRPVSVEVEIRSLGAEHDAEHELTESTRERLERLVELDRRDVGELMVPRSAMIALPASSLAPEAARAIVGSGHSRIPLFGESRDDIVGVLYAKDLFTELVDGSPIDSIRPRRLARQPLRVPETKRASDLIDEMRRHRVHLAIVLDEYGGVAGLVTLEDLLEEIVGPIDDEYDIPTPEDPLVSISDSLFEVDAGMSLEDVNDRLDLDLPTDADYQTIGGFAFNALGRLPEPGVSFVDRGVEFTVVEVGDHSIRRVRIDLRPGASLEKSVG